MPNALISVIVPVYNVASWLDRCLQSIVNQTYKTLEIILVDDGSTDTSGLMCDQWAHKDGRIRVIHKPNGGLSDARNAGIEAATGDYISFVDSDDWVDLTMLSTLYTAITDHQADLAIGGFSFVSDDCSKPWMDNSGKTFVLNNQELVEAFLERRTFAFDSYSWNKLYPRRLWDTLRFPVGELFEDVRVRSRLYAQCQKVVVVDKELYFYYQRKGSILHSGNNSLIALENLKANIQDYDFLKSQYPHLHNRIVAAFLTHFASIFAIEQHDYDRLSPQFERQLVEKFRRQSIGVWFYLPWRLKIKYPVFCISPTFLRRAGKLYKRIFGLHLEEPPPDDFY